MKSKNAFFGLFIAVALQLGMLAGSARAGVVFTSLYSFSGTNDGANPYAPLVKDSDGNFYGTTVNGGIANYNPGGSGGYGSVFRISTSGVLTNLYFFTGTNDGANPYAPLVQGSDGNFYGTTSGGGTNGGNGTVFQITTNGALTSLHSFNGNDGADTSAGLVSGGDGNFYGTTAFGGTNNLGTVFQISTNGTLTSLYSFTGGADGVYPRVGLVRGSDGNFYGTAEGHEFFYPSAEFKISTNGALTPLYTFDFPWAESPSGLVQGNDGNFYGTTIYGGNLNLNGGLGYGTVFKVTANGTLTNFYSFSTFSSPGGLVQGSDGNFYGTTEYGGNTNLNGGFGYGTVFTVTTNGTLTTLHSFSTFSIPGGLVQGSDGNFYGTTQLGGTNNAGTIFRLTIQPQLTMTVSGANVILSWPTNYPGWYLQKTVNLGAAGFVQITLLAPPIIVNGQFVVTLPNAVTGTQQFYRLSSQ